MNEAGPPRFLLPWRAPLQPGLLLRRRVRFLADVRLPDGREVTAHTANSGAMEGLVRPGAPVWLEPAASATRKLPFTWVSMDLEGVRVGVDTLRPNVLVRAMLTAGALPELGTMQGFTPEFVHAPGARVDFRLHTARGPHDVEVKNCHLVYPDGRGYFPDSVSERGARHLRLLADAVRAGHRATVLFVVQREDVRAVRPAEAHDPAFAQAAREARAAGVRFRALRCRVTDAGIEALDLIPVDLRPYALTRVRTWRAANKACSGWRR
ncbi:MAG: DNA/RNA nuclease SfsA [Polyangiales bacterium]